MDGIKILTDIDQQREKWLELRKDTVGSSEIAVIAGLSRYKTPLELWAEKTGKIKGQSDNQYMKLGRHMEKFIGELFAEKQELRVRESKDLWRHKDVAWATASPDFYIMEYQGVTNGFGFEDKISGLVECKNVNYRGLKDWQNGNYPNSYYLQTIWQLGVLGLSTGYLAGLVGANPDDFFAPKVDFSEGLFNSLLHMADSFMLNVKRDIPPDVGAGDIKLLERITKRDKAKVVKLEDSYHAELEEFQKIKKEVSRLNAEIKVLESGADAIKAKIIQSMGDATIAFLDDKQVVLNQVNKKPQEATSYWTFSVKDLK